MRKGTKLRLKCGRCGRRFKNAGALNAHLTRHREADANQRRHDREREHR